MKNLHPHPPSHPSWNYLTSSLKAVPLLMRIALEVVLVLVGTRLGTRSSPPTPLHPSSLLPPYASVTHYTVLS
jgi:hypothetical protein